MHQQRSIRSRLAVLLKRIEEREGEEDQHPSKAEELLLDIKQCLESILKYDNR